MTTYREAGVDIDAGNELVARLKKICPELGGFGGLYPLGDQYLVAGTDGVGTKLKLAIETGRHRTVGIDLVAMCVNDIITCGAKPLFFLDYYATSKLDVDQAEQVIQGVIDGCRESECTLLGGETAEMPGFYQPGEYDLSGFAVGIVEKAKVIDGSKIKPGCAVLAIPSSGVHSNGYSLIRQIYDSHDLSDSLLADLMVPTQIYVKIIRDIQASAEILGMAHITGGGLIENLPRILPKGCGAAIDKQSWTPPRIFEQIQSAGLIADEEMYRTFNMGLGMILVVEPEQAGAICQSFDLLHVGEIIQGEGIAWAS